MLQATARLSVAPAACNRWVPLGGALGAVGGGFWRPGRLAKHPCTPLPSPDCSAARARAAAAALPPLAARTSFAGRPISGSGSGSTAAAAQQLWASAAAAAARRRTQRRCAAAAPAAAAASAPALDSLDLLPILSTQGYVNPEVPEGTEVGMR